MRAGGGDGRIGERREQRSRGGERPGGGRGGSSSCKQAGAKELSARQFEVPELPETEEERERTEEGGWRWGREAENGTEEGVG